MHAQHYVKKNIANYLERIINKDSEKFIDYQWREKENRLDSFGSNRQNTPSNCSCKLLSMKPCLWHTVYAGYTFCVCVQTKSGNTKGKVSILSLLFRTLKCHVIKESTSCEFHNSFFLYKLNLLLFINTSFLLIVKEKSEWTRNWLLTLIEVCI